MSDGGVLSLKVSLLRLQLNAYIYQLPKLGCIEIIRVFTKFILFTRNIDLSATVRLYWAIRIMNYYKIDRFPYSRLISKELRTFLSILTDYQISLRIDIGDL